MENKFLTEEEIDNLNFYETALYVQMLNEIESECQDNEE